MGDTWQGKRDALPLFVFPYRLLRASQEMRREVSLFVPTAEWRERNENENSNLWHATGLCET
jgi:hypothetical protein